MINKVLLLFVRLLCWERDSMSLEPGRKTEERITGLAKTMGGQAAGNGSGTDSPEGKYS